MHLKVNVTSILLQRDEYHTKKGERIEGDPFEEKTRDSAYLNHFKRFSVVGASDLHPLGKSTYTLLISVRGNICSIIAAEGSPVTSGGIYWAFEAEARRWAQDKSGEAPFRHVHDPYASHKIVYATVRDPFWFADVLHHLREAGGFACDVPEQFVPEAHRRWDPPAKAQTPHPGPLV